MSFDHSIGLVLSGGGMRGMAHIGVVQVLRELELDVRMISGTSMGSLVGAMYAANISTGDMLDFFKRMTLFSFRNYAFLRPGIIDPERYRSELYELLQTDAFEELSKQLYVSVTNITVGKNQIIEKGPLISAILGSSAFPGIFSPVQVGDQLYSDGGITNNFPIEPLTSRCQFIIGSYVNPLKTMKTSEFKNTYSVFERAFHITMYYTELPSFHMADIFIMPDELKKIPTFSLKYIDEAYEIGYREAKKLIPEFLAKTKTNI